MINKIIPLAIIFCLLVIGCSGDQGPNNISTTFPQLANLGTENLKIARPEKGEVIAAINTNMGTVKVRFFPELAPLAVENFITHAKNGYYDGVIFHRVIQDFVIQGGDPTGTGTGGESIYGDVFQNEVSVNLHHFNGALAMANAGSDTNGSQFYIVHGKNSDLIELLQNPEWEEYLAAYYQDYFPNLTKENFPKDIIDAYAKIGGCPDLDYGYTVFGQVFEGMDIVDKIAASEIVQSLNPSESRPVKDVVIKSIKISNY